jgi:hypothetical protein
MSIMTWYHLRNRYNTNTSRQWSILVFASVMFILTFVNYITSALVLEATLIETPANTSQATNALLCAPVTIVNTVVSTLQFLLSDGLMVRLFDFILAHCSHDKIGLSHFHPVQRSFMDHSSDLALDCTRR